MNRWNPKTIKISVSHRLSKSPDKLTHIKVFKHYFYHSWHNIMLLLPTCLYMGRTKQQLWPGDDFAFNRKESLTLLYVKLLSDLFVFIITATGKIHCFRLFQSIHLHWNASIGLMTDPGCSSVRYTSTISGHWHECLFSSGGARWMYSLLLFFLLLSL